MNKGTFLKDFLNQYTESGLAAVIQALAQAGLFIHKRLSEAGLADVLGAAGQTNVQGESVQKMDVIANNYVIECLKNAAACGAMVSEETEGVLPFNDMGKYVVAVDPLDGSSNIDVAAPVGTIFAIWEKISQDTPKANDFLQPGKKLNAAGYIIYGSSTLLVLSVGNGTHAFTLASNDEFILTHPDIVIKKQGNIYSINQGNYQKFEEGLKNYIEWCTSTDKETSRPYSLRYIGSMVGDIHRTLLKGGIFIYPANKGETKGKLRLLYECIPMSYLVVHAGGDASNGEIPVLDIIPQEIHERSAIYLGSKENVHQCLEFVQRKVVY